MTYETLDRLIAQGWRLYMRTPYTATLGPPAGSWYAEQSASGASVAEALANLERVMTVSEAGR